MATGNGRRSQAGGGKTVHYLSRTGNTAAKRQTSKTDRQTAKRQLRQEQGSRRDHRHAVKASCPGCFEFLEEITMRAMTHAPAAIMQPLDAFIATTRTFLELSLIREQKTCLLVAPDVLLVISPHRNPWSPERHFCGYLAAFDRPLELWQEMGCGPWHTATPGALIAVALDALLQWQAVLAAEQTALVAA